METKDLAAAIDKVQVAAVEASGVQVEHFEVDDGSGTKVKVPVALSKSGTTLNVKALAEALNLGRSFLKAQRLEMALGPDFRQGTAHHQSLESFIAHANRFKADNSAVWANARERQLWAVLDYHAEGAAGAPRWGRHRGTYSCPLSEAWTAWGGGGVLEMDQEGFASLLDLRDRELASGKLPSGSAAPDPAALLSLAANLEVYSSCTAKRERDPNTGRLRISYSEEKGVNGAVMPPPAFLISIPVFEDSYPQTLEVRLRVTVDEGAAAFSLQVHAAGDVLKTSFATICHQVKHQTELPLFVGTPE